MGPKSDRLVDGEPPHSVCVCVFNTTFFNNNNAAFVLFAFSSLYSPQN